MSNTPSIALSNFVRRQKPESEFSHWDMSEAKLLALVEANFDRATPGYRDGVILVPVPPERFFSNTVEMRENDVMVGIYKPRKEGEDPRRHIYILSGTKVPAARVDVVLYRHDVLAETNEHSCDAEWEIISVNAEPGDDGQPSPIKPGTLMANHFKESGGTDTKRSPEEFVKLLGESRQYWNNKGEAAPVQLIPVPDGGDLELQIAAAALNARYNDFRDAANFYQEALVKRRRE